jgi:Tol biopolymer transport system component
MLLLLLLISSGCDVNIPGCGKRSLPFFKKVVPPPVPTPLPVNTPTSNPTPQTIAVISLSPVSLQKAPPKQPTLEVLTEMSISKPKALPTLTFTPTVTATPMEVEKIAYTTFEKGKPTLWTMNTDGTGRLRLTAEGTSSWFPLWSPNGKMLAFLSDMTDGKINLYTAKKGSTEFTQLTAFSDMTLENPNGFKPPFSWSPRSDEISFVYHNQVWKVDLTTLSQQTLVNLDSSYLISAIEWAPHRDNKYIAFLVKKGINFFSLNLVNPRLLDQLKLDDSPHLLSDMTWAPDARNIAYISDKNSIYTASPETSLPKLLIWGASPEIGPLLSYSPAESASPQLLMLAKKTIGDSGYSVALVDKPSSGDQDSGTLKYLTEPGVVNGIWSPDGSKIAYIQNGELWVMDALTGKNKTRIAATGIQSPNWSKK